jgi:membrane protein implicated in regulation of membrane protease activity
MTISSEILWLFTGIIFLFAEFFIPSFVIAFFGGGAMITALTTWIGFTPAIEWQLLVFIVSSVLLLLVLRRYLKRVFLGRHQDRDENQNFNIEIGKVVPVIEFIEPGEVGGKVRYQGAPWVARSSQRIAPGESVRIVGCESLTLIVEKIKKED